MKLSYRNRGMRVLAVLALGLAFVVLGQLISFSWMAITAAASSAVWMIIWLWPERVPATAHNQRPQTHGRLVPENDTYTRRG
jgi:hypothetical protein